MKKIAVTGLSGVLGSTILNQLQNEYHIVNLFHTYPSTIKNITNVQLDLSEADSIQSVIAKVKPDVILHLAAITHIDTCELDRKNGKKGKVWQVNVKATQEIATYASKNDTHLVFMSTESVFDGIKKEFLEDDPTNPLSWYGKSKATAEESIRKSGATSTILRAVIAYSRSSKEATIYSHLLKQLEKRKIFKVVADQQMTPSYIPDIGTAIKAVITQQKIGTFHITPSQKITPYQFALTLAKKLGYDKELIKPVSLQEFLGSDKAKLRVKNACLSNTYTRSALGFAPLSLDDVLNL